MVSIWYFLKFGFSPSSSSNAASTAGYAPDAKTSTVASIMHPNVTNTSTDDDFKLSDAFLPNLDPTEEDIESDDSDVQENNEFCIHGSTSSHSSGYQPWQTTIWKPHGIGRDLPWTTYTNAWDNLLFTAPPSQIPAMWTGLPKLQQPRPCRPAALMHLDEIACAWVEAIEASSDAGGPTRDTSLSADTDMPSGALEQKTARNSNVHEARPKRKSGMKVPLGVFRKHDNCYESPDPRDLPPPNFSLTNFNRGRRLTLLPTLRAV